MNYKYLAVVAYLILTFITLSASVTAEQTASLDAGRYSSIQTTSLPENTTQASIITNDNASLNLLDSVWIIGFTVAGLMLLRKVQGN
jgi:hypothetical protein